VVEDAVAHWQDGQTLDLERTFKDLTLRIIGRTLFSSELEDIAPGLGRDIDTALHYVNKLSGYAIVPLGRHLVPHAAAGRAAIGRVDAAIRGMIARRRHDARDYGDLLTMFLQTRTTEGESLSDDEVRDEIITLFVAGHETVATVLTWLHYALARQPELQTALAEASHATLAGRTPGFDDLPKLTLALQSYKEAMRLYPGGFTIGRQAICDVPIGEFVIPSGAWVMVSPFSVQRNPEIFANPERFDPERFTAEREKALPKGAYLPFGLGARTCIGNTFALMEGHTVVAALAQKVRLIDETDGPVGIRPMIALSPDRPITVRVRRLPEPVAPVLQP
jgi:cytochrome P450